MRTRLVLPSLSLIWLNACSGWYNPFAGVRGVISIALLIAQFVIAYDIVQSGRSAPTKVLWVAFVFLVPLIGVLAYLIFERK